MEIALHNGGLKRGRSRLFSPATLLLAGLLALEILLVAVGTRFELPLLPVGCLFALAFFLLAFRSPDVAWAVIWIAFPFSIEVLLPGGAAMQMPSEPMIMLALLAWVFRGILGGRWRIPYSPVHAPLATLAAVAMLSALTGLFPLVGLKAWTTAAGYCAFGYTYFLSEPCSSERRSRWVRLVVISGAFWGVYGAVRGILLGTSVRAAYGLARPFFLEHGTYSAFLAMILPLSILLTMERRGRARWGYAFTTACIGTGILLSFTRAAWLSIAIVVPVMLVLWRGAGRLRNLFLPAAAVLTVVALLAGSGIVHRITHHAISVTDPENVSNLERVNRWIAAIEMVKEHPVLGVGYGAYAPSYPRYRRKLVVTELAYRYMGAHSEPLRVMSEMGAVGFLTVLWLLATVALAGVRAVRWGDPANRLLAFGVLAGLATYVIHGFFNTYLAIDKIAVPFWSGLGTIASLDPRRGETRA